MRFEITKGVPTPDELAAIEAAMAVHKREELKPVIRRRLVDCEARTIVGIMNQTF